MLTVNLLGYDISRRGWEGDVGLAWRFIKRADRGRYLACANPHALVLASRDAALDEALQQADILVPEGMSVVLGARLMGHVLPEKVAGYDFFLGLNQLALYLPNATCLAASLPSSTVRKVKPHSFMKSLANSGSSAELKPSTTTP